MTAAKAAPEPDAEYRHGNRNSQLEIVAGRREGQGGRLRISPPQFLPHIEGYQEHDHKVDEKGDGDPHDVQGQLRMIRLPFRLNMTTMVKGARSR